MICRNSTALAAGANSLRTALKSMEGVARVLAPIALRLALATPFFRSGLTRWDGFLSLSPSTTYLFEEEFKLHAFGSQFSFPWPDLVAHVVATAEITLPILLVLGLATRFTALALLIMTAVIELVVPDGWANFHIHWAAEAIAIIALGPGPLSLDKAIQRLCCAKTHSDTA